MNIRSRKIELLLASNEWTKAELAKRCRMSRQSISTIMRRGTCEPRTLGKISAALGVDTEELVDEERSDR